MAIDIYSTRVKTIDGEETDLSKFGGKVLMVVNVASKCGLTPQYAGLQALHDKYGAKGLVVLGVPSNDFGEQEPGDEAEIRSFCSTRYKVTFPMTSKNRVIGGDAHPLYKWVIEEAGEAAASSRHQVQRRPPSGGRAPGGPARILGATAQREMAIAAPRAIPAMIKSWATYTVTNTRKVGARP